MRLHVALAADHGRRADQLAQTMDALRDQRGLPWIDALLADAVFGWRQLNKRRTVSVAAILSLGLAIGAAAAAIRLIDAVLVRPLPVDQPERLFAVATTYLDAEKHPDYNDYFDYPTFRRWADATGELADFLILGMSARQEVLIGDASEPEPQYRQFVTGNVFGVFGHRPVVGRLIAPEDDITPGGHPVAVLSYEYWTRRFARDPAVLGRTFRAGSRTYEIIGVAPKGFVGTEPGRITDVFVPSVMNAGALNSPGWSWFRMWIRPKPGIAPEQVRDRVHALFTQGRRENVKQMPANTPAAQIEAALNESILLLPAASGVSETQRTYRRPLYILAVLVALVLLIACANVANLLIAQTATRAREMALRVSIGAGRYRLIQLVLVEGALLAVLASVVGLLFAAWAAPFVVSKLAPPEQPVRLMLPADWRIAGLGIALTAFVTFLFGLAPALRASAASPIRALRGRDELRSHRRFTNVLIAAQTAFCVFVLFVASLFVTTFDRLSNRPLGFSANGVALLDVGSGAKPQPPEFWLSAVDALRSTPGVQSIAFAGWAPLSGNGWSVAVRAPGQPFESRSPWALDVSPGYFETMRIGMIAGRDFRPGDQQPGIDAHGQPMPGVAIVNESFAGTYFEGQNPVGRTALIRAGKDRETTLEIVGWVRDSSYRSVRDPMRPTVYFPIAAKDNGTIFVRTDEDTGLLTASLRREASRIAPGLRADSGGTQAGLVNRQLIRERLLAMLSLFFALVGLLLAGVGLYGVVHFALVQRRREIGVRMALGARPGHVVSRIATETFLMVSIGVAAGIAAGLASGGVLETLLFQITPSDPITLTVPIVSLVVAAALAALPSAIRAVRIDPAQTLRAD